MVIFERNLVGECGRNRAVVCAYVPRLALAEPQAHEYRGGDKQQKQDREPVH